MAYSHEILHDSQNKWTIQKASVWVNFRINYWVEKKFKGGKLSLQTIVKSIHWYGTNIKTIKKEMLGVMIWDSK